MMTGASMVSRDAKRGLDSGEVGVQNIGGGRVQNAKACFRVDLANGVQKQSSDELSPYQPGSLI